MTQTEARILASAIADELMARLQPMTDELLTADEVARLLKMSPSWVQKHTSELPHVRIGGAVRYPKGKVLAHVIV